MQQSDRFPRPRIEALADLIFALALSIGSISLIASPPTDSTQIVGHIAAFFFTFLILITAWIIYTTDMSVLPTENRTMIILNVGLLLLVALVPYLLNAVEITSTDLTPTAVSDLRDFSSSLFALDLAGIMLILAGFAHVISIEEKQLVAPELSAIFRSGRNRLLILSLIMIVSVAPVFWQLTLFGVPLRLYVWYLPLISYWVGGAINPRSRFPGYRRRQP